MCVRGLKSGSRRHNLILEDLQLTFHFADSCSDSWVSPEPLRVTFVICPVTFLHRQTSPPLTRPFDCFKHLVRTNVTSPNQGLSKHYSNSNKWIWKTIMSNNIFYFFLFTFDCWSVCMYVCAWCSCVGVYFFPKPWEEKAFCFWKTLCKYCWWKINICCTPSFHLSLEMMTKTTIFMNNSGDVDDTEADYTCPSWTRAFDVCCIFVGGVVRSGQEKQREGVIPNTSRIRRSNTATYPLPSPTPPGNCAICGANRSLCFSCHKALLHLCCKHQNQQRPAFQVGCTPPCGATLSWFAWHPVCLQAWGFTVMPLC